MSAKHRILALAGSLRRDSYNRRLLTIAVEGARQAGGDVTVVDLADYPLPLMDEDLEASQGLPAAAVALKKLFVEHDGLLWACPEYNSSITPLLKNTIDWVSRRAGDEPPLVAYRGKTAVLISASPGELGGLRGLVHVRSILGNIGVIVLPEQVAIPRAAGAFNDDGTLKDTAKHQAVQKLGARLVEVLGKLKA